MSKGRLNISADQDLVDFIKVFASENRMTVADIFTQCILSIKRRVEGEQAQEIFANPLFQKAMSDARGKLQEDSAVWHSYDEVFGDS